MLRPKTHAASGFLLLPVLIFSLVSSVWAGASDGSFMPRAGSIAGTWLTRNGDAQVTIFKKGGEFLGKLAWLREPNDENGRPARDGNNPDPKLRGRTILGLVIIHAVYQCGNLWKGGVYDPDNGKTYNCVISLASPDALRLRGYLGISLLGKTEIWKRLRSRSP